MDFIITFFRDILDGPVYIVVTVICSILICACIGYLAEKSQKKKREKEKYVEVSNTSVSGVVPTTNASVSSVVPSAISSVSTEPVAPQVVPNATLVSAPLQGGSIAVEQGVSQVGPVQIDKPQVVAIPIPDGGILSQPIQSSTIATAPSVQPVVQPSVSPVSSAPVASLQTTPQNSSVPTSVNPQ